MRSSIILCSMSLFKKRCSVCKCCAKHSPCTKTPEEHLVVFNPTRLILSTLLIEATAALLILVADATFYIATGDPVLLVTQIDMNSTKDGFAD